MCLAVPVRVVEVPEEGKARVQVGQGENYMEISTLLLPEAPRPATTLLCMRALPCVRSTPPKQRNRSTSFVRLRRSV